LGITRCGKLWPNFASTLQIELTLADTLEAIWPGSSNTYSTSFELQNIQIQVSAVTLDSQLQDSYNKVLLSGKNFSIPMTQFFTSFYAIAQGQTEVWIPISRALSRLKSAFTTFSSGNVSDPTRFYFPDSAEYERAVSGQLTNSRFKSQLSVGSLLFPEKPCDSIAWHFRQLELCLGLLNQTVRSTSIQPADFRRHSFIVATLLEKVVNGWGSGLNLQSGSQLRYQLGGMPANNTISGMHICLVGSSIVEIGEKGVSWYT
jgi:hypothetical protein